VEQFWELAVTVLESEDLVSFPGQAFLFVFCHPFSLPLEEELPAEPKLPKMSVSKCSMRWGRHTLPKFP
jgi:hypothetical protein